MTLDEQLNLIGGCGDGNCIVFVRSGQHTNGGCRCHKDAMKMQRVVWAYKQELERLDREFERHLEDQREREG